MLAKRALTSLEEDFKVLGLSHEPGSDSLEECGSDDMEEEDCEDEDEDEDELDEARRVRKRRVFRSRASGAAKIQRGLHRTSSGERLAAKRNYRKGKAKIRLKRRKPAYQRMMKKHAMESTDSLASVMAVLAEVRQQYGAGAQAPAQSKEAPKAVLESLANVAMISEILGERLEAISEENKDTDLQTLAGQMGEIAEEAAATAEALGEHGLPSPEAERAIVEDFKDLYASMLKGLEAYVSLTEDEGKA